MTTQMAGGPLAQSIVDGLLAAAKTEDGADVVGGHNEYYEFAVDGEKGALLHMIDGAIRFEPLGVEPPLCGYTRVEMDPQTVASLRARAVTPARAMADGGIRMRSRLYGGGQFSRLLRIAQQIGAFDEKG
jgi:hypothetical protein